MTVPFFEQVENLFYGGVYEQVGNLFYGDTSEQVGNLFYRLTNGLPPGGEVFNPSLTAPRLRLGLGVLWSQSCAPPEARP